ncbi:hypothetical protein LWI28_004151 [Acer negundo]|uniref:Uncharacterized protein n=1 Tax=Acer negundo TaxID=4023 RepID=A0AAD5IYX3_ACENE|nr:hypothetical protein LWI28_004151 [Acer negundo]
MTRRGGGGWLFSGSGSVPRRLGGSSNNATSQPAACREVGHRQSECKKLGKRVLFAETDEDDEDEAFIVEEPQFDEDDEINGEWVEGDAGPLLMARPVYDTTTEFVEPEEGERVVESPFPLVNKDSTGYRGVTANHGTAIVVQRTYLAPRLRAIVGDGNRAQF